MLNLPKIKSIDEYLNRKFYMHPLVHFLMKGVKLLEKGKYECSMCGVEHEREIDAIQCGCGYD